MVVLRAYLLFFKIAKGAIIVFGELLKGFIVFSIPEHVIFIIALFVRDSVVFYDVSVVSNHFDKSSYQPPPPPPPPPPPENPPPPEKPLPPLLDGGLKLLAAAVPNVDIALAKATALNAA